MLFVARTHTLDHDDRMGQTQLRRPGIGQIRLQLPLCYDTIKFAIAIGTRRNLPATGRYHHGSVCQFAPRPILSPDKGAKLPDVS